MKFLDAAERYLADCVPGSRDRARIAFQHLAPFIGALDLGLIHEGSLTTYRAARRRSGAAAGTINLEVRYLQSVLTKAARVWRDSQGRPIIYASPLFERERGATREPYPLTWEQQRTLFSALPDDLATLCLFLVNTGVRAGEARALRWDWEVSVPELGTTVFVLPAEVTKTRTARVVVLNSVARSVLSTRPRSGLYVFTNNRGQQWAKSFTTFRKVRDDLGIPARIHDLRHTFGQRLRAGGVDVETRADLLGHKAGRITTHYSAPDLERLMTAAETVVKARPSTILRAVTN
jgi:integrase